MKKYTTIRMIVSIAIIGLLIASAAALPSQTKKDTPTLPSVSDVSYTELVELLKDTQFKDSLKKIEVNQKTSIQASSLPTEMESALVSLKEDSQLQPSYHKVEQGRKQLVKSYTTRPALGTSEDGNILLGFEWYYLNLTEPVEEIEAVIWQGHNDFGNDPDLWCGGIYWININTGEPIPFEYPSTDYWGLSSIAEQNQWFASMVQPDNPETPEQESGYINIMQVEGDPCNNESFSMRTWDFSNNNFHDMVLDDMACCDGLEFPVNKSSDPWGISSYIMSNEYADPVVNGPHVFYPIEYQGSNSYALINWFYDSDSCSATAAYMDDATKGGYAIWDPYTEDQGKIICWYGNDMNLAYNYPNQPGFDSGGWTHWLTDPNLDLKNPAIAANNDAVVAAVEVHNKTNPNEVMLSLWWDNSTSGDVGESFTISGIWYIDTPEGGKIQYPEISHVQGHTFICTAMIDENLTFAVSYDAGETWDGFYVLTEEYPPIKEYRSADIADQGSMAIWEYAENPDHTMLIYSWTTATFDGYCWYNEIGGEPVENAEVSITNLDIGQTYESVYTDSTGYYAKKLILGLDAYSEVLLLYIADDGLGTVSETEYQWLEISSDVHFYSLDLILETRVPGDANGDGFVNIDDIFFVLAHWGETGGPADVNDDGTVNIDDIFFILAHWT